MRVITGKARGARLITAEGTDVRPTAGKIKEAMFSAIQFELEAAHVLDLYAGSGQLGIEALSRGASDCVFVDNSKKSLAVVAANLEKTKLMRHANLINSDCLQFLSRKGKKYDIIFADPPYGAPDTGMLVSLAREALNPNGMLIIETAQTALLPETDGDLTLKKSYRHGITTLWLYRKESGI